VNWLFSLPLGVSQTCPGEEAPPRHGCILQAWLLTHQVTNLSATSESAKRFIPEPACSVHPPAVPRRYPWLSAAAALASTSQHAVSQRMLAHHRRSRRGRCGCPMSAEARSAGIFSVIKYRKRCRTHGVDHGVCAVLKVDARKLHHSVYSSLSTFAAPGAEKQT